MLSKGSFTFLRNLSSECFAVHEVEGTQALEMMKTQFVFSFEMKKIKD